jgi:hypothetical protein
MPKNEIGPWPVRAELTSRARTRSGPKPKTVRGPLALRPRSPSQAAMGLAARDGKQPSGPLTLGASRAPGRNLGLGRESFIPPGLKLGPVSVSRPSKSDGCTRFPAEQNRARRPRANPSLILRPPRSLSRATVEWPLQRFYAFARPDEVASVGSSSTQIQKRSADKI